MIPSTLCFRTAPSNDRATIVHPPRLFAKTLLLLLGTFTIGKQATAKMSGYSLGYTHRQETEVRLLQFDGVHIASRFESELQFECVFFDRTVGTSCDDPGYLKPATSYQS